MATSAAVDLGFVFDGNSGLGDPGLCGPYDENDWATLVRNVLVQAAANDRAVYREAGNEFQIVAVAAAQQVQIQSGAAAVNGTHAITTATKTLDVPANATGSARKDRVVLEIDLQDANETASLKVLIGTAANYASLTQNAPPDDIWQIPLWRWETPNGFTDLTTVTFVDERQWANLPAVTAANLSNQVGSDIEVGAVLVQDTSNDNSFTTSTTAGAQVIGVAAERIISAGSGKVAVAGLVQVQVTGTVARGDLLAQSGTAGRAEAAEDGAFAIAFSANAAGTGTIWAVLMLRAQRTIVETIDFLALGAGQSTDLSLDRSGTSYQAVTVSVLLDPDMISNAKEVYFEVVMRTEVSTTGYAILSVNGSTIAPSALSTASTTHVRLRSGNIVTNLPSGGSAVAFEPQIKNSDVGKFTYITAARLIVIRRL